MSNPLGGSPLAPAHRRDTLRSLLRPPRLEPPVYGTPTTPTQFIHLAPSRLEFYAPAIRTAMRDIEFVTSWRRDSLMRCWQCGGLYGGLGTGWFHVCDTNLVDCRFCGAVVRATCDGRQRQIPEHGCRILAPFLDEARRLQCPAAPLPSSPTSGSPSSNPTCGS